MTRCWRLLSSSRLSALGMPVVSTITCCVLAFWITPPRAASMLAASSVSTPSSPTRFLQRVRLDGQYGSSAQVFTTVSSEASKVCCRYSSPAIRRGGKAGRPHAEVNETANERSTSGQSINAASLTSG
ncbi:hypothetical protein A9976_11485 [Delftia sp. UME58]|nr:hypothetical protein [Delftia sp. UME58]